MCGVSLCNGAKKTCFADFHTTTAVELGVTVQPATSADGDAAQASNSGTGLIFADEDGS